MQHFKSSKGGGVGGGDRTRENTEYIQLIMILQTSFHNWSLAFHPPPVASHPTLTLGCSLLNATKGEYPTF